jgi:hypothetical protein
MAAATPPQDEDDKDYDALPYHNEEAKEDSDDFVACIFHEWQASKAEGREFDLPPAMTDDEIANLSVLVSQVD